MVHGGAQVQEEHQQQQAELSALTAAALCQVEAGHVLEVLHGVQAAGSRPLARRDGLGQSEEGDEHGTSHEGRGEQGTVEEAEVLQQEANGELGRHVGNVEGELSQRYAKGPRLVRGRHVRGVGESRQEERAEGATEAVHHVGHVEEPQGQVQPHGRQTNHLKDTPTRSLLITGSVKRTVS